MRRVSRPEVERCEDRALTTLVFVLNGASFAAAGPSRLTSNAAAVLHRAGSSVVQLSYPAISSPAAFNGLANRIARLSHGQTIGLVGFSAGGALALRIAGTSGLKVSAVLDYYGVPDVRAYLAGPAGHVTRPISGLAPFREPIVSLLSGPITTSAHIDAAFGQFDPNVRADLSSADLLKDAPSARTFTYPGGHGVSITASPSALEDFLSHL